MAWLLRSNTADYPAGSGARPVRLTRNRGRSQRANRIRTRSGFAKALYGLLFYALRCAFCRTPRADPEKSRRSRPGGPYPQDERPGSARKKAESQAPQRTRKLIMGWAPTLPVKSASRPFRRGPNLRKKIPSRPAPPGRGREEERLPYN